MKIKISELKANPYRDIENYPINKEKISTLKDSIERTGFWDNVLARKHNGHYELAYGHHRLEALRQLGHDRVIDIPVKDLDDATMIRIMANENMEQWQASVAVIDETVRVVRNFLQDKDLATTAEAIYKFLGSGWDESQLVRSMARISAIDGYITKAGEIRKPTVSKTAVESMPSDTAASNFAVEVKKQDVPIEKQELIAKEIVASGNLSKQSIAETIHKATKAPAPKAKKNKERTVKVEELFMLATSLTVQLDTVLGEIEMLKEQGATVEDHPAMRLLKTVTRLQTRINRMLN